MARRPGHEDCRTCGTCGLTNCPDCDTAGKSCPLIHEGVPFTCGVCGQIAIGGQHSHSAAEARASTVREWLAGAPVRLLSPSVPDDLAEIKARIERLRGGV